MYDWYNATDRAHVLVNAQEEGDIKGTYIARRFRHTIIKLADASPATVRSKWGKLRKRAVQLENDYNTVMKFIKDEIKFKYEKLYVTVNVITFVVDNSLVINCPYKLKDGKVHVKSNQGSKYIHAGESFIKMQKEIAQQTPKHVEETVL